DASLMPPPGSNGRNAPHPHPAAGAQKAGAAAAPTGTTDASRRAEAAAPPVDRRGPFAPRLTPPASRSTERERQAGIDDDECGCCAPLEPARSRCEPRRHRRRVLRFLHLRDRRLAGVRAAVLSVRIGVGAAPRGL